MSEALDLLAPGTPVVIDPVMVSESGAVLLDEAARRALVRRCSPAGDRDHPNLPEARVLAGDATAPATPRSSPARCTRSAPTSSS